MYIKQKEVVDDYIENWYFGKGSYLFAFELAEFLFGFMDYIDSLDVSDATKKKHFLNCWSIGRLETCYGYQRKFIPEILKGKAVYEEEFKRKFGDSKYALQSYRATWNKLNKYIIERKYLINYRCLKYIDEENQIIRLETTISEIIKYLEKRDTDVLKKDIINYGRKAIWYYMDYEDRVANKEYIDQLKESVKNIELIETTLNKFQVDKEKSSKLNSFLMQLDGLKIIFIEQIWDVQANSFQK